MRLLLFLGLAIFASAERRRFDGCDVWELTPKTKDGFYQLQILARQHNLDDEAELIFWDEPRNINEGIEVLICAQGNVILKDFLEIFQGLATKRDVDLQAELDAQYARADARRQASILAYDEDDYNTYEDIMDQLDVLQANCPAGVTCTVEEAGQSYEGRSIRIFRISKPGSGRLSVFMDSLIHCREWLAGATNMGILTRLITQYGSNPDATRLVDTYDWHFIPVFNPDGYTYTWTTNRFWRKNRTPNQGSSCLGTDLNRNHNFGWGTPGSSTNPCSETYRGPTAGSEPEVQVVESMGQNLRGSLTLWMSYHTYGQYYLFPYGMVDDNGSCRVAEDDTDIRRVGDAAVAAIQAYSGSRWVSGSACGALYAASGITCDWAYGAGLSKYSFTPELRGGAFNPTRESIAPSVEENWRALVAMINEIESIEGF